MGATPNLSGVKTLVVDDDAVVRTALRRLLSEWGAQVTEVDAATRAIVELKQARESGKPFGLVFVDSTLSPIDGFELVERMRAHPEEFEHAVLMVGPDGIGQAVPRARKLGVAAYVAKPLVRPAIVGAVAAVLDVDSAPDPATRAVGGERDARHRILVAEDSADAGWILRGLLEGPDYQVDVARDGGVAVDLFRIGRYDLVLMDIQMPNFDGYWATREIRAWERENGMKRTPIIAVTAYQREEDPQKTFRAGLDGYLAKPILKDALMRIVHRYLPAAAKATA